MTCPSSEMLVAAAAPDAAQDVRATIADHLVSCPRCAEEFRVLSELGSWAADHAHLLGESAGSVTAPAPGRNLPALRGHRFGSPWAYATAAVLVLAVAALEVQVQRLQRDNQALAARAEAATAAVPAATTSAPTTSASLEARVTEQQRTIEDLERRLQNADVPDLNAPIIDLEPADAQRSPTGAPPAPVIPPGARSIVFILNTTHAEPGASHDVELIGAGNRVVWSGSGLKQSADRTLTLVVPRALVRDATSVRLYSRAGPRKTLIEQFAIPIIRQ